MHLLRAREDIELQRLWVALALQMLDLYLVKIEVRLISGYPLFLVRSDGCRY